jgi:signal transduction histidine kinase
LSDLKITVDSLEPVEGDVVALIGNLRHRLAGDLSDAGITCKWEVGDCQPIEWLDPTNALHVLRIMQEAIANVLSHSRASEMTIGCKEATYDGVKGVAAYVADNGRGFDPGLIEHGKGLANMRARASSLHGHLASETQPGEGSLVRLWLPYHRSTRGE